jgi:hypothetical protein
VNNHLDLIFNYSDPLLSLFDPTFIAAAAEAKFDWLAHPFHHTVVTGMDVCVRKPLVVTCGLDKSGMLRVSVVQLEVDAMSISANHIHRRQCINTFVFHSHTNCKFAVFFAFCSYVAKLSRLNSHLFNRLWHD